LIIRLLFVIGAFTGGWGILIYVVLWLLVPEAKTSSERLQMAGKPVTIGSLKETVERADVKGAAARANRSLAGPVNALFSAILKLIGIGLVVIGLALLLSLTGGATYAFLRDSTLLQNSIFPVGLKEHLVIYIGAGLAAIVSLFVVLFGMAMYRRKWPIHAWITGVLAGMALIGLAVGGALAADVAPQVRDRYNANMHTTVRTMTPFSAVNADTAGDDVAVNYRTGDTYSVSLRYFGHPDLSTIKTSVSNGVLMVETRDFNGHRDCHGELCIPDDYSMVITITSPTQLAPVDSPSFPASPVAPSLKD
jgi:PspC domain-containing protein